MVNVQYINLHIAKQESLVLLKLQMPGRTFMLNGHFRLQLVLKWLMQTEVFHVCEIKTFHAVV